jgi:hypothetical protein
MERGIGLVWLSWLMGRTKHKATHWFRLTFLMATFLVIDWVDLREEEVST